MMDFANQVENEMSKIKDSPAEGLNANKTEPEIKANSPAQPEDEFIATIETEEGRMVICPNCKTMNNFLSTSCRACGYQFKTKDRTPILSVKSAKEIEEEKTRKEQIIQAQRRVLFVGDVLRENVKIFVGEKGGRYVTRFEKVMHDNNNLMWNWGAFFGCYFWYFYRRMTKIGLLFMLVTVPYMLLIMSFIKVPLLWPLFWLVPASLCALTADSIYKNFVFGFLTKQLMHEKNLTETPIKQKIAIQSGNPSMTNVFIAGLITAAIGSIYAFIRIVLATYYIF